MKFKEFLKKHNTLISFLLGIIGFLISFIPDSSDISWMRLSVIFLLLVIFLQWFHTNTLNELIVKLRKRIVKYENTADNISLELLDRFSNTPERNHGLDYEEIKEVVQIKGFDVFIEAEYKGRCINVDGEDSLYCEIFGDSNIKFDELNFIYTHLNGTAKPKALKGILIKETHKLFVIRMRFTKKLTKGETFHIKYSCQITNCMNYGDDYYTVYVPKSNDGLKKFDVSLIFDKDKPEFVEVFDASDGGESKFLTQLNTEDEDSPFLYVHSESGIMDTRDYVFKFRRLV